MSLTLTFLGAARCVTGSRYFLQTKNVRLLIDCGLFQEREHLGRNWEKCPIPCDQIDALLLTHAHLDHSGLIPRLVAEGFKGPIFTTAPSRELTRIILEDAAKIQVEDAAYKKQRHQREGRQGPHPQVPLYTPDDVASALPRFRDVAYSKPIEVAKNVSAAWHDAGHILGSALVEIRVRESGRERTLVFSGDLGQRRKPLIHDPTLLDRAEVIVMESTYGDRLHPPWQSIEDQLCTVICDTVQRGGNIVIPTFAIERAQELMYYFNRLAGEGRMPDLLVFLDSPMAISVTDVFERHLDLLDAEARQMVAQGHSLFEFPGLHMVQSRRESQAINRLRGSCIILAGAGMCSGGRIKHHLIQNLPRPESTILFTGYQARGTLGRQILEKAPRVRIHGKIWPVKAKVAHINGLSAHGDQKDLLHWLGHFQKPIEKLFLTHGEPSAAQGFSAAIRGTLGYEAMIPEYQSTFQLF